MIVSGILPVGPTVAMNVTASAHSVVQAPSASGMTTNYLLSNIGTSTAFVFMSPANPDGSAPTITAVAPVDGTPTKCIPVIPSWQIGISGPPNAYFSAICPASGSTTLFITPGDGKL